MGARGEQGSAPRGARERESYLLNCAELKASGMCRNNANNLMHDVIYLMSGKCTDED